MSPDVLEFVAPLIAVISLGGFSLIGLKMVFNYRIQKQTRLDPSEVRQVLDSFDELHEQMTALRDEVGELHERVDFAERLLTQGNAEEPPPERERDSMSVQIVDTAVKAAEVFTKAIKHHTKKSSDG